LGCCAVRDIKFVSLAILRRPRSRSKPKVPNRAVEKDLAIRATPAKAAAPSARSERVRRPELLKQFRKGRGARKFSNDDLVFERGGGPNPLKIITHLGSKTLAEKH
jgi:hypothetical protein